MSLEEKAHASLLRFQKRVVRRIPVFSDDISVDLDEVVAFTQRGSAPWHRSASLSLEAALALSP